MRNLVRGDTDESRSQGGSFHAQTWHQRGPPFVLQGGRYHYAVVDGIGRQRRLVARTSRGAVAVDRDYCTEWGDRIGWRTGRIAARTIEEKRRADAGSDY